MKNSIRFAATSFLIILGLVSCGAQRLSEYSRTEQKIGTFVKITVIAGDEDVAEKALDAGFAAFDKVNDVMSTYKKDSNLSEVNLRAGKDAVKVDPSLIEVIERASLYTEESGGMFDVSVGPLLELWGFYRKEGKIPSDEEIQAKLRLVNSENIIINENESTVMLKKQGMKVDLGAIAKGWAIDRSVESIKAAGVKSALVNAGGDIYALGEKPDGPWTIGVKRPDREGYENKLKVMNEAVVTSGCYERFFLLEGKRYCHIINAVSGMPTENAMSVTVVAPDATRADAMATTVMLLGPKDGLKLLEKTPSVEGMIIFEGENSEEGTGVLKSASFDKYIAE